MRRLKQAFGKAEAAPVSWEVWGILDKEVVCKTSFTVDMEEEADEEVRPSRTIVAESLASRLIPPPDYSPSGRIEPAPKKGSKQKAPAKEPPPVVKKMVFCPSCGAKEEDPDSQYCGRCGKALE
jgi:hypothetical protein